MAKKYELTYYQQTGQSDPIEKLEDIQAILFNETASTIPLEELKEGAVFTNNEGELITLTAYSDNDETDIDE